MTAKTIWLGEQPLVQRSGSPSGDYVVVEGEHFYRIRHFDLLADFFISLVSYANHWLFISSSGALTAGRTHSGSALFPYYTEDKIAESAQVTGHRAVFLVSQSGKTRYWEPFARHLDGVYRVERNLYKNTLGSTLIFEEINHDLELTYRYSWQMSHRFGFVKKSRLSHQGSEAVSVRLLDGLQNLLPYGVTPGIQNELSCLIDAYKKNELHGDSGVAMFSMSSLLTDRAEPSECLSATTVWSFGLAHPKYLLSSVQVDRFRHGLEVEQEQDIHGRRGAYFVVDEISLGAAEERCWGIVADVNQGPVEVANLINQIMCGAALSEEIADDLQEGQSRLRQVIGMADGFQMTSLPLDSAHHTANVLFNVMRGGFFDNNYWLSKRDLQTFCQQWNRRAARLLESVTAGLPEHMEYHAVREHIEGANQPLLMRLFLEYLPLTFSRRHGDPSRPWNQFSIDVLTEDNQKRLAFAGNWRDIFQNWEALSVSAPGYIDNMICKFLSATTADGYNPYRITRDGIDWERPEPENPWANIGYWGDHQVIYLSKLIELAQSYFPQGLQALLARDVFAYANVPYRIKRFEDLLTNPYDTIHFDHELDRKISHRVNELGADGRLLWVDDEVYQVNLLEKLLAMTLSKLTNFVPGGGIWMNTQRPEWNDANNALVGTGISVVTLCYLHRFLKVLDELLAGSDLTVAPISDELLALFDSLAAIFQEHSGVLSAEPVSDALRYTVLAQLGRAGEAYRETLYQQGLSGRRSDLDIVRVRSFIDHCLPVLASSIRHNRREDGLFHAYNRLRVEDAAVSLVRLDEMLEGQVAVLSAKLLSAEEALAVLRALRWSSLHTPRQHSYLLYPHKVLPRFVDKNRIPENSLVDIPLLKRLIADGNTALVARDELGGIHFNGMLTKVDDVEAVLGDLSVAGIVGSEAEHSAIKKLFIETFRHDLFTGRSGAMYAYEGIGSIYWHMVSKLLLAVSENVIAAKCSGAVSETLSGLRSMYEDVRSGLGSNKSPEIYGAFPTDPYSHTPGFGGARQPGMTGQVKEEVLSRVAEMGVIIRDGSITFDPVLLRSQELLSEAANLYYVDVEGQERTVPLASGQLGFTLCQVPIVIQSGAKASITASHNDGSESVFSMDRLPPALSHSIFMKQGQVSGLTVTVMIEPQ